MTGELNSQWRAIFRLLTPPSTRRIPELVESVNLQAGGYESNQPCASFILLTLNNNTDLQKHLERSGRSSNTETFTDNFALSQSVYNLLFITRVIYLLTNVIH